MIKVSFRRELKNAKRSGHHLQKIRQNQEEWELIYMNNRQYEVKLIIGHTYIGHAYIGHSYLITEEQAKCQYCTPSNH